jgi:3-deoxy-D-manno-octulosonic-acid transferase
VEDKAATVVRDGAELTAALVLLLENADQRIHLGKNAQRHVLAHRGAAERTAELICRFLPTGQVRRDDAGMKAA